MPASLQRARPFVTVVAFSILPFAVFLDDNRAELRLDGRLAAYPLLLLVPGLALVLVAAARRGRSAAERAAVLFAVATFVLFRFAPARDLAEALGTPATGLPAVALWAVLAGVALAVALRLSRHPVVWSYVAVAGILLAAVPLVGYLRFVASDDRAAAAIGADETGGVLPAVAGHAGEGGPNVYFFLLDGYPRTDQVRKYTGFDNRPFDEQLRDRHFAVEPRALAAYPMTLLSMSSTLSLDYLVTSGRLESSRRFYDIIRGESAAVRAFRRLGYQFVLATDYQAFSCIGREDVCITPAASGARRVLGDREWALLGGTPLVNVLPRVGVEPVGDDPEAVLEPAGIVSEIERRSLRPPFFVQAHVLAPHPPYRYREDCSIRSAEQLEQTDWGDVRVTGQQYADTIACLNQNVLEAVDRIPDDDIVILASDHGSAFGIDTSSSPTTWTPEQLEQRYATLSSVRLPPRCRSGQVAPRVPVNTFRIVLACITGERIPLLPERHFAADYGDRPRVSELPAQRLGAEAP